MDRIDKIIKEVKKEGDRALIKYTLKFDQVKIAEDEIEVTENQREELAAGTEVNILKMLKQAAQNIERYSGNKPSTRISENQGIKITDRYIPVEKAGIYVPGGKFPYPSTVLMCAIPARQAGVKEIMMSTPPGNLSPAVAAAANIAGVDRIFRVGGVQAIAAMAFGTETIPAVNKIAGPGNSYVQEAKLRLSGVVGIDMVAGPSEVVIIASGDQNPRWAAFDLMAQAEHGKETGAVLIFTSGKFARKVQEFIPQEFSDRIKYIKASGIEKALDISNEIAPEHLQLMLPEEKEKKAISMVRNAGAVFTGAYTPACLGDYWAGPSHTLPTGKAAKYQEGLSVRSFLKKVSFINCSAAGIKRAAAGSAALAGEEGMKYHRLSALQRLENGRKS